MTKEELREQLQAHVLSSHNHVVPQKLVIDALESLVLSREKAAVERAFKQFQMMEEELDFQRRHCESCKRADAASFGYVEACGKCQRINRILSPS